MLIGIRAHVDTLENWRSACAEPRTRIVDVNRSHPAASEAGAVMARGPAPGLAAGAP